jgi:hypothetical protein
MTESFHTNLVTKLWVTINNNVLFIQQLNEYLKLAKIVMLSMLGSIEDEQTFSTFAYMKDKFHNRLGLHLDKTIHMFPQKFFIQNSFPYQEAITTWKDQKVWIGATF